MVSTSKQVFQKVPNIHKKTPVLQTIFNKVAGQEGCHFVKKRIQGRCFPVKFAKILRTTFFHKTPSGAASVIFK